MLGIEMRRASRAGLVALMAALASCTTYELNFPTEPASAADRVDVVDAREIVAVVPTARAARGLRAGAEAQGFTFREEAVLSGLNLHLLRFEFPQPLDGAGAIAALETLEPLSTAGINHAYRVTQATGPGRTRFEYANTLVNWPQEGCRARVRIGMIDTGVNAQLLRQSGAQIVTERFVDAADGPTTHGTDVAALLVDPRRLQNARLYSAAVIGGSARGIEEAGTDDILKALDWLAAEGVKVVNISLSGPYNKILDRGIDHAAGLGMTLVAAVGNEGPNARPRYPAAFENVIAVTAVDAEGDVYRRAVQGEHVDIAAPGVDILVPGSDSSRFVTGTSMAAPFVTALIAGNPGLARASTPAIRAWLGTSARDLGAPGPDETFGAGLLAASDGC